MERKEESGQEQTTQSENFSKHFPGFESPEVLLAYYAHLYGLLNPYEPSFSTMGLGRLKALCKNLRKHLLFLQELSEHEWGEGFVEVQAACSAFMMRESLTAGKRMEISNKIGALMEFLVHVAENRGLLKHLYAVLNQQYQTLCMLIKREEINKNKSVQRG